MALAMRGFSKNAIDRAGRALAEATDISCEQDAIEKVNWWRSIHKFPLQRLLDDLAPHIEGMDVLVAGRVKKFDTIVDKLKRPKTPGKLKTMYDIAGCRVVVNSLAELERLCCVLLQLDSCDADKSAVRDYVSHPRSTGYRGRHIIVKYRDEETGLDLWAELQVRTAMQHAWATAVEMYDMAMKDSRLKFGEVCNPPGSFFRAASFLMAAVESGEDLSSPSCEREKEMLRATESECDILGVLVESCEATSLVGREELRSLNGFCLLDFNLEEQYLSYSELEHEKAVDVYFEQECEATEGHNLVLVKGSSLNQLQKAYPNYFGDISEFVDFIRGIL